MEKTKRLLRNPQVRGTLVVLIVVLTFGIFGYYLWKHPEVVTTLTHLPASLLAVLALGYIVTILANAYVLHASLRLLDKRAPYSDNILLTSYSSIINFFGPLQSGPGARALYLKAKYSVRLRDFFATTLIFYGFFALINCVILGAAAIIRYPSVLVISLVALTALLGLVIVFLLATRSARFGQLVRSLKLHDLHFWQIGVGAALLVAATAFIYFAELHHVASGTTIWQAIVYSAAANLALFVSLTPGAIGFRETFLVLSEKLHGIATPTVLSASIIDRAFYIVFLAVLFVIVLVCARAFHLSFFGKQSPETLGDNRD